MWKIAAIVAATAIVGLVTLNAGNGSQPASAGISLPPGGEDIFDINGQVTIDLGEIGFGSEKIPLSGTMTMLRSDPSTEGTIDIEIVAMSLTGMSNLLKGPTPIVLSLNPNGGPALGLIDASSGFPAESYFDIPFMDAKIGEFQHFLNKTVQMSGSILGVPAYGDKFDSGSKLHPIIDNDDTDPITGLRGFLSGLNIDIKPPDKSYTVTVLKQHDDTKAGLPGWEMNIYGGSGCNGTPFDSAVTDADGIANFAGLAAGTYSVEEKLQPGWNNVTPLCQDTTVPGGAGAGGVPACPIQPDLPPPDAGCDEFNSAASVKVQFTNPPSDPLDCDLGGPTLITRSAVVAGAALDSIQTEIVAMNLTGTCGGAADVTVRESSTRDSTGKITEQKNNVPGELEFKANSFFDIFFEVDTPIGKLHNQEPLRLECKIQSIPPFGCVYEPEIGSLILYNVDKKEVAKLIHAAHIPLDPKQKLLIFVNVPKLTPTATAQPGLTATPTATAQPGVTATPTATAQPGVTVTPTPDTGATDTPTPSPTHTRPAPTDTPEPTDEPGGDGDANKDGTVDSRDVLLILQSIAGFIDPPPNSDVNGSGTVSALDAALVLQHIVGFVPSLPV